VERGVGKGRGEERTPARRRRPEAFSRQPRGRVSSRGSRPRREKKAHGGTRNRRGRPAGPARIRARGGSRARIARIAGPARASRAWGRRRRARSSAAATAFTPRARHISQVPTLDASRRTLWKGPTCCAPAYDLKFSRTIFLMTRRFFGPASLVADAMAARSRSSLRARRRRRRRARVSGERRRAEIWGKRGERVLEEKTATIGPALERSPRFVKSLVSKSVALL
jgi:hypothetical protein